MSLTPKIIDWSYYTGKVSGYGDCRAVVGEYACLLPDRHVESFLGIAPLPHGQNVNYLRIPRNPGDGRMAGGGQDGAVKDQVLEWQWPAGWVPVGTMFGPNGVIYGAGDVLTPIHSRAEYQLTAGWRYVDPAGALVSCESTYADRATGVYEWTMCGVLGSVIIGQGAKPDMGAVVSFDGEPLRRLDPRPVGERTYPFNARFMHSDRRGDLFGICIVDLGARKTYFLWPTLAELRALPLVTDTPIPPIPPVEPPVPTDYLAINQRVRAKYPTPLGNRHWEYLVDFAQQARVELYVKPGGANVLIPPLNVRVSLDVVGMGSLGNQWADTLRDAEGAAIPIWSIGAGPADGSYLNVSGVQLPGGGTGPTPPPTGECQARVAELEQALRDIETIIGRVL